MLMQKQKKFLFISLVLFPLTLRASFIEATIGTAVVNDATATYHNPAALTLLTQPQFIALGSGAYFHTQFTGQAVQSATGFTQTGTSSTATHYYLPSFYFGVLTNNKITFGVAVLGNDFNRDIQENSILRYVQSNNHVQNVDFVPAIGIKLTDKVAVGAGLNFSYADFVLQPIFGFPSLTVPDSQSHNESSGTGWGGDAGLLLKPTTTTLIGFNYQSAITYNLNGNSQFEGTPAVNSNSYHFKFWTPARSILSISQWATSKLGFIGTLQRIQWSIFSNVAIYNIATPFGILPQATVPYHLHNTWLVTLGSHYRITPAWIVRIAASYNQTPANGNYQISNGNSVILGASTGYTINKNITLDGSYAHAFIQDKSIHIITSNNIINGTNKGFRDSVSLKLTYNFL